ncbi:MAG: hypothetical protein F6K65_17690 [Moorea sp. SIO3C2]|nr:hypothetical protein [Moorena sp. SIO3C2]
MLEDPARIPPSPQPDTLCNKTPDIFPLLPLAFPSWEGLGVGSSCLLPLASCLLPFALYISNL